MKKHFNLRFIKKYLNLILISIILIFGVSFTKIYNTYVSSEISYIKKISKNTYFIKTLESVFDTFEPRYLSLIHI